MMVFKKIAIASAIGLFLIGGKAVLAESTYGYSTTNASVSAEAKAKVTVNVPTLVLLRVGTAGKDNVDTLTFNAAPDGISTEGSKLTTTWEDGVPVFSDATGQDLAARAWTNAAGGAELSCDTAADAMFTAADGLQASDVKVASSGTLDHPEGATTECAGAASSIAKNTLLSSTWTYSILGTALANAAAGTHTQTTTYTITTL